jgi:hypothetical protein
MLLPRPDLPADPVRVCVDRLWCQATLRQAPPGYSLRLETSARNSLAGQPVTGSLWRLAEGQDGGDQVV